MTDFILPSQVDVTFINCTARSLYGHNIGAFPYTVVINQEASTVPSGYSQQSPLLARVIDYYEQTYFLLDEKYLATVSSSLSTITLSGLVRTSPKDGVYNFTDLEIKGIPGESGSIFIESDAINKVKHAIVKGSSYESPVYEF